VLRGRKKYPKSHPPAFDKYLIVFLVYLIKVPVHVCTVLYTIHQIQVRYLGRYQPIRPPLTQVQGGLLLGVGDGGRVVRYRTPFSQKIAQVLEEVDQRAFSISEHTIC
jgi:hypothetical protein